MANVLIVHASRHGATQGIADRIGRVLESEGHDVTVAAAATSPSVGGRDAVIVGSGVYMGSWLDDGIEFLRANGGVLSSRRVWVFSSGPLTASTTYDASKEPIENALGPAEGPGSGGRRKLEEHLAVIAPREHRVFAGAYDPTGSPKSIAERFVRIMPTSKNILPPGDYRDWTAIEAWGHEIAATLGAPVAAG
ncbi:MAG TPA: flavodoxin domain-containing protein [Candidatus Limnocylindrales bacterium]|nr:flavodoxin domain-containing protein [Candidatus Limnocylindrales bacterium]